MKRNISLSILLVLLFFFSACDKSGNEPPVELKIGALVPMSGELSTYGESVLAALELAVEDLNVELAQSGQHVSLYAKDNETSPDVSSLLLNDFLHQGIRLIIGPMSSENLLFIKDSINHSEAILISQSSTSTVLSISGDNIFRVVPNDQEMGKALVAKMNSNGVRQIYTIYRDGVWGTQLNSVIGEEAALSGISVLGAASYFSFRYSEYAEYLDALAMVVEEETKKGTNPSEIGVVLLSYDEGSDILEIASEYPALKNIQWYGSDGLTQSKGITQSELSVSFAREVGFQSPSFKINVSEKYNLLVDRLESKLGYTPSTFAILSYDALYGAAMALLGTDNSIPITELRTSIFTGLNGFEGASGRIELDENGDRVGSDFAFWKINDTGAPAWVEVN